MDNEELLKDAGFEQSSRKTHLWFKATPNDRQYIDLQKMECYAYEDNTAKGANKETHRILQTIKALDDKDQVRLF